MNHREGLIERRDDAAEALIRIFNDRRETSHVTAFVPRRKSNEALPPVRPVVVLELSGGWTSSWPRVGQHRCQAISARFGSRLIEERTRSSVWGCLTATMSPRHREWGFSRHVRKVSHAAFTVGVQGARPCPRLRYGTVVARCRVGSCFFNQRAGIAETGQLREATP
jgi:hypothetical protein